MPPKPSPKGTPAKASFLNGGPLREEDIVEQLRGVVDQCLGTSTVATSFRILAFVAMIATWLAIRSFWSHFILLGAWISLPRKRHCVAAYGERVVSRTLVSLVTLIPFAVATPLILIGAKTHSDFARNFLFVLGGLVVAVPFWIVWRRSKSWKKESGARGR